MKTRNLIFMGLLALVSSSCIVSQRKYDLLDAERLAAETSRDSLSTLLNTVRSDYSMLQGEQAVLSSKYTNLSQSQATLQAALEALKKDTATLNSQIRSYATRLDVNKSKTATLNEQLQKQLEELNANKDANATLSEQLQKQLEELNANKAENAKLSAELDQRQKELSEREQTIEKLQGVINDQNERVKSILNNVKSALTGFNSDQLTVREEGGKVYVAMSEKLLFPSGKATVNEQGKKALGLLADVLNKQTDIDVTIEGHTDSQPIKTAQFADNWDLSVIRATSVVRILTQTYHVNPLQILPCGRGEYKPVDTNETKEGRAHNRRTEIIISPKLDKLYEIITAQ